MKRTLLLLLACLTLAFAQGVAIGIVMRSARRQIDTRFFRGRFYWKPRVPALSRAAKASVVPVQKRKFRFAPPFIEAEGKER